MNLPRLLVVIALTIVTLAPSTAHAGDCTEDGSPCAGLGYIAIGVEVGIAVGGAVEAAAAVGGLVTMIGGSVDVSRHRASRGWRVANYVFAGLNLAAGFAWGIVAADRISTQYSVGFALPHLAIGAGDLAVALVSSSRGHDAVRLSFAPLSGRDASGHALTGAGVKLTF